MSVAFRRESDDEHREPSFELPLPPGRNLVTARGLALIEAQVAELEALLDTASGDDAAKRLKRDLRYWHQRASSAEVQPVPDDGVVAFGSQVTYRLNGQQRKVAIVGSDEADPAAGRIPYTAPLAQAMLGAEAGEVVDFGGRTEAIEILFARSIGDNS
jgi:transcription elongation GreA/GreB family factor